MKGFVLVVVLIALSSVVNCQRPQRTKLVSGGIYRLESQHDGAVRSTLNKTILTSSYCRIRMILIFSWLKQFLTAFGNGKVGTKQATGGVDQGQRWTFTQNGEAD
jgi:hypothetical protein